LAACPSNRPVLLVVDDDDAVRDAVAFVLSGAGYKVVLACSGEAALTLISDGAFDGLYTGIQLTGLLTGWDVGEAFHARWPTKPIAYASARGWPHARFMPTGRFLRKPFLFQELVSALHGNETSSCGGCPGSMAWTSHGREPGEEQ
jgi:CheY-like chemotaxis protein